MPRPRRPLSLFGSLLLLALVVPAAAQEPEPAVPDTSAAEGPSADSLRLIQPVVDPRITLLGDTLAPGDTIAPRFTDLREFYPDSFVDPYTLDRPGARPAWVLTGEELLGRGAFSLLDVLESEALVLAQDLGGGGLPTFLVAPGGTGSNVAVFVDGIPVGGPFTLQWDLRQVPLESIERVAWYPGPQTAAWGSGATGGALVITTRRAIAPAARSILAFTIGTFDVETFSGNFGRPIGGSGHVFVGANFDSSDGFLRVGDYTRNQFVIKGGWGLGRRHEIELSRLSDDFSGDAGRIDVTGTENRDRATLHGFYRLGVGPLHARAHGWRGNEGWDENFTYRGLPGLVGEGDVDGGSVEIDAAWGRAMMWASARHQRAEVRSDHPAFLGPGGVSLLDPPEDDPDAPRIIDPRETTEWAGGAGFGGPEWPISGNVALRRVDPGEAAEAGTAWQAEASGRPVTDVLLRATAGRGVRAASPLEQAVLATLADEGTEVHPGRPADPSALEEWTEWRVEATWSRAGWRLGGKAFAGSADGAFLWLPPAAWISFDRTRIDDFRLAEIGFNSFDVVDLSYDGFEAELAAPLPWGLRGRLWYRHLDATADDSGEAIPYVPDDQGLGQLRWVRRLFPSRDLLIEARAIGRYQGKRSTLNGEVLPEYLVADALLQATIVNFTLFISFKNVFDQVYRSEEAFALPGIEGFFGINWRFHD